MNKGFFITIEGCEGCGKSTQSSLLAEHLKKKGYDVLHTREPGGTAVAESIRGLLLNPDNRIAPVTELLLYEAGRAQHIAERILPAMDAGKIVICDRYTDATIAYQGYGRKLGLDTIRKLNRIATGNLKPGLTILLDFNVAQGLKKARMLAKEAYLSGDRLERENISFHKRVREGYLAQARREPGRIKVIRTAPTIEETHRKIVSIVEKVLKAKRHVL